MNKLFLFVFFVFILFFEINIVSANGFGVSPSSLNFSIFKGSESSRQVIIYNTGNEDAFFNATTTNLSIALFPSFGLIEKNSRSLIEVKVSGSRIGEENGEVIIRFSSPKAENMVSLGMGLSVKVGIAVNNPPRTDPDTLIGSVISAGIIITGFSSYSAFRKLHKSQAL
jgi:hypothetical protein